MLKRVHGCINILSLYLSFLVEGCVIYYGWGICRILAEEAGHERSMHLGDSAGDPSFLEKLRLESAWLPLIGFVILCTLFQLYLMGQIRRTPILDPIERDGA